MPKLQRSRAKQDRDGVGKVIRHVNQQLGASQRDRATSSSEKLIGVARGRSHRLAQRAAVSGASGVADPVVRMIARISNCTSPRRLPTLQPQAVGASAH